MNLKVHGSHTSSWIPRALVNEVAKPLPIISEKSAQTREIPTDWNRGNITPTSKKAKREDKGEKATRVLD